MNATKNKLISALFIALALTACGKKEEAQTAAPAQAVVAEAAKPAEMPAADEQAAKGEKLFKATCAMCHQTGAAGAPIVGKKEEWSARIAQGMPMLYDHALKGYTGKKGMMPAKGANTSAKDEDVKAAVDYMVNKSK